MEKKIHSKTGPRAFLGSKVLGLTVWAWEHFSKDLVAFPI